MKKIYYISILASLMASQSNFAAEDKEEEFLLTIFLEVNSDKTLCRPKNCLLISNKIKGSNIKIGKNEHLSYSEEGQNDFKGVIKINEINENNIFGDIVDFNQANPAAIFTKDEIIPFIDDLLKKDKDMLLNDLELNELYKNKQIIEFITKTSIKIMSKSDQDEDALTEDYETFKKRITSTQIQKPSNNDDETDKTQSGSGSSQEPITTNNNVPKKIVLTYKMEKKEDAEALKKAFGETIQKLKVNDKTLTYEIMEADYMKGTKDMDVKTQTTKDVQNRLNEVLKSQGETLWNKNYCIRITQKFEKDQKPFAVLKFDANTGNTLEVSIEKAGYFGSSTTAWLLIAVLGAAAAGGTYYAYTQGMLGPKGEGKGENGNEEGENENDVEGEE